MQKPLQKLDPMPKLSRWQILGPFPAGMREQDFGADPLEAYGGIHNISYSETARYPSELSDGGLVGWQMLESHGSTVGPLVFPSTRWSMNQLALGWAVNQFQAWAVISFSLEREKSFRVQFHSIGDFYIDQDLYSGDWYNLKTTAHVVHLAKGEHTLRVRVVNEIRIFGGSTPPKSIFEYFWEEIESSIPAIAIEQQVNMPDIIDSRFAGHLCSIAVQNVLQKADLRVVAIQITTQSTDIAINASLRNAGEEAAIMPGQIRQIPFSISTVEKLPPTLSSIFIIHVTVEIHNENHTLPGVSFEIHHKKAENDAFRITFEDQDKSIQYAMVRSPKTLTFSPSTPPPILVALHGAGVETSSPWWTGALSRSEKAWASLLLLIRLLDRDEIEYAHLIQYYVYRPFTQPEEVHGDSIGTDQVCLMSLELLMLWSKICIFEGHSNGGQGAWYLGTHFPDRAIAVFAAAGYTKIQDYVPFTGWIGGSHSDPWLRGILESSIAEYNNDLHVSNLAGIPIHALMGGDDDNVPPLHTRKYARLANEYVADPEYVKVTEVPGEGHWWNKILDNEIYSTFIEQHVENPKDVINELEDFTVTLINPSGSGSKGGIFVEQLSTPYRLGRIHVKIVKDDQNVSTWYLTTNNIRRFRFTDQVLQRFSNIRVDGSIIASTSLHDGVFLEKSDGEDWKTVTHVSGLDSTNHGPLHRIYESRGPLVIVCPRGNDYYYHKALQIAHDWNLYGNGDAQIIMPAELGDLPNANIVFLGGPEENELTSMFLRDSLSDISITKQELRVGGHIYSTRGSGIIFHQLWRQYHMAIIIAGIDQEGFTSAVQLMPKRTGLIISDWVVTGPNMKWQGVGGIQAA
ncbi:hypothetical protein INT43_005557, partial [Umbelopsis isabellina]